MQERNFKSLILERLYLQLRGWLSRSLPSTQAKPLLPKLWGREKEFVKSLILSLRSSSFHILLPSLAAPSHHLETRDFKGCSDDPSRKKSKPSSSSSPTLREIASQKERLQDAQLILLYSFVVKAVDSVFCFFNQAWKSLSESLTTRHRKVMLDGHLVRALVLTQDQNKELEVSVARAMKLEAELVQQ
ncbi:Uncharacterized protein Fot_14349 [Forsythia ovata]|uniref:Uncharacterized protein n=1 Tax=Forsythia ovata TaxID=205694 RepID=A0ABD1W627_9LAMI